MDKFTPYEYVLIAIANANGMDKNTWDERLSWADSFVINNTFKQQLEFAKNECEEEPILMAKAIKALNDIEKGLPTGFLVNLDATASGIQVMSACTGCHVGAEKVNLIDNGKRNDLYRDIATLMNSHGANVDRTTLKKPIMTKFYGSNALPKQVFGAGSDLLKIFDKAMATGLAGAYELLLDLQSLQDSEATSYTWTLPDGHTAHVPVMDTVTKKIEIAELNKATFSYRTVVNQAKDFDLSIAANVVHSLDGYVVRQLYRRAHERGYSLATIHDSFWASPLHIEDVRIGYNEELAKLADSDVLTSIFNEITGGNGVYQKRSNDLSGFIRNANYALS